MDRINRLAVSVGREGGAEIAHTIVPVLLYRASGVHFLAVADFVFEGQFHPLPAAGAPGHSRVVTHAASLSGASDFR